MFRKASKSVSISIIVLSPDPLSLTVSTSTTKTEENPYDREPAAGVIQMEYLPDTVVRPKYKSSDEKLPVILWLVEVLRDNPAYSIIWHIPGPMWARLVEFCCMCIYSTNIAAGRTAQPDGPQIGHLALNSKS